MGQSKSKENSASKSTRLSSNEIDHIRKNVKEEDQNNITENVFKDSVKQCVPSVSPDDDVFLKRLFAAFGGDENKSIDFNEFVDGLGVFIKGSPEEKLKLSFKLYDVDKDELISKGELEHVMLQLSQMLSEDDQSEEIQRVIDCMFQDLDIDGDGKLSFEEYKLSAMKEPLIADFVEHFLDQHNLSNKPKPVTPRPVSLSSSGKSSPQSIKTPLRLSFRLSQAELLEYSHQQQMLSNNNLSDSSSPDGASKSALAYLTNINGDSTNGNTTLSDISSPNNDPNNASTTTRHKIQNSTYKVGHRSSASSLDAAMVAM